MIINMNGAKAPETPSPVLQEKTVTPETLPTVIGADEGYDGLSQVTVNPDAQLKAENIRSGKTIFGVSGSFTGETVMGPVDLYQVFSQSTKDEVYAFNTVGSTSVYDKEGNSMSTGVPDTSTGLDGRAIYLSEADEWYYKDQIYSISNSELGMTLSMPKSYNIAKPTTAHINKSFFASVKDKTHLRGKLCYMLFPGNFSYWSNTNFCFQEDAIQSMDVDVNLGSFPYTFEVDVEFPPIRIGTQSGTNFPLQCIYWFEYVVVD